ncbi:LacI family DNA-binding transcriptional regulator [Saccharothrix luteola]|uniref:LacI family DNA-binding transcriptional regulator n=1 Tax=Saccharothrix luteola TaxID=2893018 RepID=UPI001E3A73FD|nr:LacI family DNA-binding transcriptional regulator [Saccharothrix luteola]MCC8246354.1 LacI family DNA-binding transcriptional regulator [Saccharothrix luteola]
MNRQRVTLADVAKAAGVSITTVSLVLSGRGRDLRISAEAELRVRQAVNAVGYRRKRSSTGSRTDGTRTIGFISDAVATSGLAGDMIRGAVDAAREHGALLIVAETDGDRTAEQGLIGAMLDREVDGIVYAATQARQVRVPDRIETGRAVLLNVVPDRPSPLSVVVPDEVEAGRAAARALLDAGHRDGIHLVGAGVDPDGVPPGSVTAAERLTGIREVLDAAGVEIAGARECRWWLPEHGFAATRDLLERARPRALICFDDRLAFGAYQALADAGLVVPVDVSVVSFDDHPLAGWLRPGLTTVAVPRYELGAKAVEVLLTERHSPLPGVHRVPMPRRDRSSIAPPRPADG